jgi:lysyl-tRNA synthetase, class I
MNWAENHARKIIEKFPNQDIYICASGITPSGFIHIGNFREYFTVELVSNELKKLGKNVRHIHSWDNFDPLRKVPKNIPEERKEEFKNYIGMCITDVPDPFNKEKSYADYFINKFENELKLIGCSAEFLDQEKIYRSCKYKDKIKIALNKKEEIKEIYNRFRTEPLRDNWWPVTLWCEKCNKITDIITNYDGNYIIEYKCKNCNHQGKMDFSKNGNIKLRWRVDWPMRWSYYNEHFEPSGKDHMSAGGSNDMAQILVEKIFNGHKTYAFMYEFIGIKGGEGKMSSSNGNIYTIKDVLKYYIPEIFRYLYVSTKPNSTFDIQLDENIFQIYNEFYNIENKYYNNKDDDDNNNNNKINKDILKIYELSNINLPTKKPNQPTLQEFITLHQVLNKDAVSFYIKNNNIKEEFDIQRINQVYICAKNWLKDYATDKYKLKDIIEYDNNIKKVIIEFLEKNKEINEDENYQNKFYNYIKEKNIDLKEAFKNFYILLFNKDKGPKLGSIIEFYGSKKILEIIKDK